MSTSIFVDRIRLDGGTQSRAETHDDVVVEYAEKIDALPPVVVFHDGAEYWLADGFHRVLAHKSASRTTIDATIHAGTRRDAILYSVGANNTHGMRRTNADKRRAVETLLRDEEWAAKSDGWIAEHCGVSQPFVSKVRPEVTTVMTSGPRTGRDGKAYPPAKSPPPKPSAPPLPDLAAPPAAVPAPQPQVIPVYGYDATLSEESGEHSIDDGDDDEFVDFVEAAKVDRFVHEMVSRWPADVSLAALVRALKTALHGVEQRERGRAHA